MASEIADAVVAKRTPGYKSFRDTIPVLSDLNGCGFVPGLHTNGGRDSQSAKLEYFALFAYFKSISICEETGVDKPDPAVFEQGLDATAAKTRIVGDHLE